MLKRNKLYATNVARISRVYNAYTPYINEVNVSIDLNCKELKKMANLILINHMVSIKSSFKNVFN